MKFIMRYLIMAVLGALLASFGLTIGDVKYWAWLTAILIAQVLRDISWDMK